MEVTNRKPIAVEDKLKKKLELRGSIKSQLERIDRLEGEIQGELWKHIKEKFNARISELDQLLYAFDQMQDRGLDQKIFGALGARRECVNILAIEQFVQARPKFEQMLEAVNIEINELKRGSSGISK